MPQLVTADFMPQLAWLAITFTLLYLFLARVALPRIATTLETRHDVIANDLDEAARLKRQGEEALKTYEAALASARAKATAMAAETRARLNAEAEREKTALQQSTDKRAAEAEAQIAASKAAAMANVRQIAADAASAVVGRLLGDAPDRARLDAALDTVLPRHPS